MGYSENSLKKGLDMHVGSDTMLFWLTIMLWSQRILVQYARVIIIRLPIIGIMADTLISLMYIVLILFSLPAIVRRLRGVDYGFGIGVVAVYLLNYVAFPDNEGYLDRNMETFLLSTFPLYYIGVSMDYKKIYPWLYRVSMITIFLFSVYNLFISNALQESGAIEAGDMWASYNLLPHVAVVILQTLRKAKAMNIIASVVGIAMLMSLGTRGTIVCLAVVIAIYLIAFREYRYPALARIGIIAAAFLLLVFLDDIMRFLQEIVEKLGMSVRIFEKYFDGELLEDSGRSRIQDRLMELVRENPVKGYGLFADRSKLGSYAHHIVIELWVNFGVIVGTGLLAAILALLVKTSRRLKDAEGEVLLILPLFGAGLVKLFMSGSYLNETNFFLLLGLCVCVVRNHSIGSLNDGLAERR